MEVTKTKQIEGCMEGTNVVDILLDIEITANFIIYLGKMGKSRIVAGELPKPYFQIIKKGQFTIKGIEGNKSLRVLLAEGHGEEWVTEFKEFVSNYNE